MIDPPTFTALQEHRTTKRDMEYTTASQIKEAIIRYDAAVREGLRSGNILEAFGKIKKELVSNSSFQ